jgi:hypothetical protein
VKVTASPARRIPTIPAGATQSGLDQVLPAFAGLLVITNIFFSFGGKLLAPSPILIGHIAREENNFLSWDFNDLEIRTEKV